MIEKQPRKSYDVILVGAGSIGTPLAFYLSKAGLRVLVIDQNASVGQGSNKKAIGGIRATHSDPTKIRLCMDSLKTFSTWKEEYGDDIEWYQGGYCFVAYHDVEEQKIKNLLRTQKDLGLNISWLDRQELLGVAPDLNPVELRGGSFSPEDGSASPLLVAHSFYTHAIHQGAEFRFNETVTGLEIKNDRITGIVTNCGSYASEIVVNAAGAQASEIAALAGIKLPVYPDAHEAAVTEPVSHFLDPMIVDIRMAPGSSNFYFYQHATGQFFFCITPEPKIWGNNTEETSNFLPQVANRLVNVMPRLNQIRIRRTWRGLYPMTPDGFPIVGWCNEVQGFYQAAGMCGQGFMLGPGVGELVTRNILNQTTPEDEIVSNYVSPYRTFSKQEMLQ